MTLTRLDPGKHDNLTVWSFVTVRYPGRVFRGKAALRYDYGNWYVCHNHPDIDGNCPYDDNKLGFPYSWEIFYYGTGDANSFHIETTIPLCPKEAL